MLDDTAEHMAPVTPVDEAAEHTARCPGTRRTCGLSATGILTEAAVCGRLLLKVKVAPCPEGWFLIPLCSWTVLFSIQAGTLKPLSREEEEQGR